MDAGPSIPSSLLPLLTTNMLAALATVRPDGRPAIAHVWVDWDGQHVLTSSPLGSRKARNMHANPYVALHIVDPADPWRWLSIRGRLVDVRPDEGLAFIDRLCRRYRGADYATRDRQREIFVIEPMHVRAAGA